MLILSLIFCIKQLSRRFLKVIYKQERAHEFIETTIGKLIRYDYDKGTNYLSTLEVILQCSNLKEAAQLLFLHHNTVVFRKRRIEEILDRSIHEFDTKVMLAMAIKLYKLNS